FSAGAYSLMFDNNGGGRNLDPFHRMKSGLGNPRLVPMQAGTTFSLSKSAGDLAVLYDPTRARGDKEYFVLENRSGGIDATLPSQGLVLWRMNEDHLAAQLDAPEAERRRWGHYAVNHISP